MMELRLIPAWGEATEVGSMSSTSGCGATEEVSHARSMWKKLSEGEGSNCVKEAKEQLRRWSGAELSWKSLSGGRRKTRMIKCLMLHTMWYTIYNMVYTIHSMLYITPIYWYIGVVYHMVYTICMDHSLSLQAKLSQRLLGRLRVSFTGASDSQAVRFDIAYFIWDIHEILGLVVNTLAL